MYAQGPIASAPIAALITTGALIIPEVGDEGKELVFVVEIDLVKAADDS